MLDKMLKDSSDELKQSYLLESYKDIVVKDQDKYIVNTKNVESIQLKHCEGYLIINVINGNQGRVKGIPSFSPDYKKLVSICDGGEIYSGIIELYDISAGNFSLIFEQDYGYCLEMKLHSWHNNSQVIQISNVIPSPIYKTSNYLHLFCLN